MKPLSILKSNKTIDPLKKIIAKSFSMNNDLIIAQCHISVDLKEWKYAKCLSPVYLHKNCKKPGMRNDDICYIFIKCLWSVNDEYLRNKI